MGFFNDQVMDQQQERIDKLEKQLFESNQALLKAGIWQGESQKREAVLREALEHYASESNWSGDRRFTGGVYGVKGYAKARAALEANDAVP